VREQFKRMTAEQVKQAKANGLTLYDEQLKDEWVFPIMEASPAWTDNGAHDPARQEPDELQAEATVTLTRTELGAILSGVVDMLGHSKRRQVRLHLDIMRHVLNLPGALQQHQLAAKWGKGRDSISKYVKAQQGYTPLKGISFTPPTPRARGHPDEKKRD
jgi:hypothetical protein